MFNPFGIFIYLSIYVYWFNTFFLFLFSFHPTTGGMLYLLYYIPSKRSIVNFVNLPCALLPKKQRTTHYCSEYKSRVGSVATKFTSFNDINRLFRLLWWWWAVNANRSLRQAEQAAKITWWLLIFWKGFIRTKYPWLEISNNQKQKYLPPRNQPHVTLTYSNKVKDITDTSRW